MSLFSREHYHLVFSLQLQFDASIIYLTPWQNVWVKPMITDTWHYRNIPLPLFFISKSSRQNVGSGGGGSRLRKSQDGRQARNSKVKWENTWLVSQAIVILTPTLILTSFITFKHFTLPQDFSLFIIKMNRVILSIVFIKQRL